MYYNIRQNNKIIYKIKPTTPIIPEFQEDHIYPKIALNLN